MEAYDRTVCHQDRPTENGAVFVELRARTRHLSLQDCVLIDHGETKHSAVTGMRERVEQIFPAFEEKCVRINMDMIHENQIVNRRKPIRMCNSFSEK